VRLAILEKGTTFGDEDIMSNEVYNSTLVCKRKNSCLYTLSRHEFERVFKQREDVWQDLLANAKLREENTLNRCE
jgi:CRP-like cAMP-binding protein